MKLRYSEVKILG